MASKNDYIIDFGIWKRFKLRAVMAFARWLHVPIDPHQTYIFKRRYE